MGAQLEKVDILSWNKSKIDSQSEALDWTKIDGQSKALDDTKYD